MASGEHPTIKLTDAPSSFRSKVWKHFGFREGESREIAVCKACFGDIPYKAGNTSNLQKHIDRKHPEIGTLTQSCCHSSIQVQPLTLGSKASHTSQQKRRKNIYAHISDEAVKIVESHGQPQSLKMVKTEPAEWSSEPSTTSEETKLEEENQLEVEPPCKVAKQSMEDSEDINSLFGDVFVTGVEKAPSSLEKVNAEIQSYRNAPCPPVNSDPLEWWKERVPVYPILSQLALQFLTVPATSVESERVFSTAGDIVSHQRASLSSENVDRLVFLKKNMQIPADLC